jgi:uncharacterized protein YifE (UPF0438 family)
MFVVERKGQFLMIETKGIKEPLTEGQRILLVAVSRQPKWTAVVIYGEKGWPEYLRRIERGEFLEVESTSRDDFQRRIDDWYRKVNQPRLIA